MSRHGKTSVSQNLLAIQTFVREKVCRCTKHRQMTRKLPAIHGFRVKRVCRCREKSWEKERRLVNLGCREADLARGEDRGKQRAEVNRQGVSAELCQGVRLDQFTCLIGYSIQYESMTGSSFISYGTNIESPSHQDFRSSVINPS